MCDAHFGGKWEFMSRLLLPVSLNYMGKAELLILFAVQGEYKDDVHQLHI